MANNFRQYTILTLLAMVCVAFARFMPHPFNFTPVAAMALYGGAKGRNSLFSFALPLMVMLVSDILLMTFVYASEGSPYDYFISQTALGVYLSFAAITGIGLFLKSNASASRVLAASLASSLLFYGVTNFFTWMGSPFYPQNLSGLTACYAAGIPFYNNEFTGSFFLNQFAGDLFFSGLLFGAHAFVSRRIGFTAKA
jgi:hypothetical protein